MKSLYPKSTAALAGLLFSFTTLLHCASSPGSGPCSDSSCNAGNGGNSEANGDAGGVGLGAPSAGGGSASTGGSGSTGPTGGAPDGGTSSPAPASGAVPRIVAYVNVTCGFGVGTNGGECAAQPDPTVNYVKQWEDAATSPITHYVLSFLSFQGASIQTDPGEIWKTGGSTTDFTLIDGVREALVSAQAHGKKVMLSIGGQVGSTGFTGWWSGSGATSPDRVAAMGTQLQNVADAFTKANGVKVDGFDIDIELGGIYAAGSDKYVSTRDLINAVPESFLVAFVPQVGNVLCAAPNPGDALSPATALGGQCQQPVNGDDSPWVLAHLDTDCKRSSGAPKLDYWGIQYYNAGQASCCGGGSDPASMIQSTAQNYVDLANGWAASGNLADPASPWHSSQYYPGPWAAFGGIGADRLVLGKPGCEGCAGSDFLDLDGMSQLVAALDGKLAKGAGGILFWDLGRLFADKTSNCVSGSCQPSWGGTASVRDNLAALKAQLAALKAK